MQWLGKFIIEVIVDKLIDFILNLINITKEKSSLKKKINEANRDTDRVAAAKKIQDIVNEK